VIGRHRLTPAGHFFALFESIPLPPLITLDAVTAVRPGGEPVVRDLTWTIRDGETWAIVGPTGAGKTSLAEVLLGRHRVTDGTIAWPMFDHSWPADAFRLVSFREQSHLFSPARHYYQQRFNFVEPQDDLTLEQYLRAGASTDECVQTAGRLGLTDLLPCSFIALSTGQMRRARIAKALITHPKLLILDDPFLGLDATGRDEVAGLLGRLVRDGMRIILITRPGPVPDCVTHVLELDRLTASSLGPRRVDEGDGAALGTAAELLPLLARQAPRPPGPPVVELRNVTVAYGDRIALRDVSWTVRAGERWAVVGPNGSGKTTLLSLLCGDHPQAYANDVQLFGRRRGSGESIWDVKRSVGLVSSELHFYYAEPLTAAQVAATGFRDVLAYRPPTLDEGAAVVDLFEQYGIAPLAGRRFDRLSTGEQRLVLLVRALVKQPPLMILDEPFQGLDRAKTERARDWLDARLRPEQTLIVVTHDAAEIPRTVSHELRLDDGRIVSSVIKTPCA
jgi:molybdate transport system ATP-binding protein